jgi:hypothetical protein
LAQFSPATGKNKIKQDQEQQKAFLDYVTTTKISASVPKQNNNNNNQTKPKQNFFWLPLPSVSIVHILISHTCTSQIFSGFTFFVFVLFSISHVIFFLSPGQQTKRMEVCGTVCYVVVAVVGCPPSSKIPAAKL